MTGYVAADLDRTLAFSARAASRPSTGGLVCIEQPSDRQVSFATPDAVTLISRLFEHPRFVLVTSRGSNQMSRVRLPGGPPRRALCANGARLLIDGDSEREHAERWVDRLMSYPSGPELAERVAADGPQARVRCVDDTFAVAVCGTDTGAVDVAERVALWAGLEDCVVTVSGRRVYVAPSPLTKGAALLELLAGSDLIAAAGDSWLDVSMLALAREVRVPRGAEIAASAPAHCLTRQAGVDAGEEIARWLVDRLRDGLFGSS